jgi:ubiquitin-like modifier-activating enzyme ATG7
MENRTLDQQCTVTRPGVSMAASGYASELMINEIQTKLKKTIGPSPSFVRGIVGSNFEINQYENTKFSNCLACSEDVAKEYLADKKEFLYKVKSLLNGSNVLGLE